MNAQHTPTPWRVEPETVDRNVYRISADDGSEVADVLGKHEAARIVRAVNAHEALVVALREFIRAGQGHKTSWERQRIAMMRAEHALHLAEGGQL